MRYVPALTFAALLLSACASSPPKTGEAAVEAAATTNVAPGTGGSAIAPEWQQRREKYTACATDKASSAMTSSESAQRIAAEAVKACSGELDAVRTSFRDYLNAQMVSSHGKRSAQQAAERLGRDTEDKVRAYLVRHVEYERSLSARK
ncbi:hypothetical protein [Paracidovorax citrulli]